MKKSKKILIVGLVGTITSIASYPGLFSLSNKALAETTTEQLIFTTDFVTEDLDELKEITDVEEFQSKLEEIISSVFPSLSPPVISDVKVENITEDSATVSWWTNVKSTSYVGFAKNSEYKEGEENPYKIEISAPGDKTREHKVDLVNLSPGTLYHYQVRSESLVGVVGKSKDLTFSTQASKIKLEIPRIANTEIEVRWYTTVDTDSSVEYKNLITGQTSKTTDPGRAKSHVINLTNLAPNTSYELRGFGYTENNILVESDPVTAKTKLDITSPKISNIRIDNALLPGTTERALTIISWKTDELSNSIVRYEEGIGVSETLANKVGQEKEYATDHIVIITTKPGSIYRVQSISADESNNEAKTTIRTILTPRGEESVFDIIFKNFSDTFKFLQGR